MSAEGEPNGKLVWRDYTRQGYWTHSLLFDDNGHGTLFGEIFCRRWRDEFGPITSVHYEVEPTEEEGNVGTRAEAKRMVRKLIKEAFSDDE